MMDSPQASSDEASPLEFQENYTSAALDGARIACVTASVLVELDSRLSEPQRMILLESIALARRHLDVARMALPVETTSVHIVRPNEGLIIPG